MTTPPPLGHGSRGDPDSPLGHGSRGDPDSPLAHGSRADPDSPLSHGSRQVVLALGSNLGDRLDNLQGAIDALFDAPGLDFLAVSPVYETAPAGGPPQPDYLNAVIIVDTALACRTILDRAHGVEEAFGRVRRERWGPRTLDVDLIVCGDTVSDDPELTLPHPRAHERVFVLLPWHDIDPGAEIPGRGSVAALLDALGHDGVRRAIGSELQPPG
ncbi:MAG TPA: 2-amino-4-hydroxy-6-hydroxymethyldihydropteridine diphosphokinase [Streptosporangiaceae bacterium]|nr:2-amino-4-hydroxy-6-hydroxymethyldihydropteridine diphosphokinase [Streptosporangiaceae bacterium]